MPFWNPKPNSNEDYIAQEREQMDTKRRKFLDEYYRKKANEQGESKSSRFKTRFASGAQTVGRGLKRASEYRPSEGTKRTLRTAARGAKKAGQTFRKIYEYEPSAAAKKDIRRSFKYARSEVAQLGRISPRSRSRERYRSGDDDEMTWDQYFGGDDIANYAEALSPPGLRMDWQGRQTAHRYSSDRAAEYGGSYIEPGQGMDAGFTNPLEGFDMSFSDVASSRKKRGRSGNDLYFNPLAGYDDYFTQLAGGKRKRKR